MFKNSIIALLACVLIMSVGTAAHAANIVIVNLDDIMRIIDAFQGGSFPCDKPCDEKAAPEESATKSVPTGEESPSE